MIVSIIIMGWSPTYQLQVILSRSLMSSSLTPEVTLQLWSFVTPWLLSPLGSLKCGLSFASRAPYSLFSSCPLWMLLLSPSVTSLPLELLKHWASLGCCLLFNFYLFWLMGLPTSLASIASLMLMTPVPYLHHKPILSFKAKHPTTHWPSPPGHPTDTSSPVYSNGPCSIWALKGITIHRFAQARNLRTVLEFSLSLTSHVQLFINTCQLFLWNSSQNTHVYVNLYS